MRKFLAMTGLGVALLAQQARAYDFRIHYDISAEAVARSVLSTDPEILKRFGFDASKEFRATAGEDSPYFTNDCRHGSAFPMSDLIACGAQFEDYPARRVLNHFYDPTNNGPLTVNFLGLWVNPGSIVGPQADITSPDWALEDGGQEIQEFSYKDARAALFLAMTDSTQAKREEAWGRTFQSLGQVIHHLQDMAQPQHVRNDQHLELPVPFYFNPSLYERYTTENPPPMQGAGSDPVFVSGTAGPFAKPRDFWQNASGRGLAELVNRNFLSAGTNFFMRFNQQVTTTRYQQPSPGQATPVPIESLPVSDDIRAYCNGFGGCTMTFYSTGEGTEFANARASALSIFDQYVQLRPAQFEDPVGGSYQVDRFFTLNRFTFESGYPLLMPRAVGYSAGLLNFFFRGKMKIMPPQEGIYAVVDHYVSPSSSPDPKLWGFGKLKARVQNLSPAAGNTIEPMQSGNLYAVARYHLNNCYRFDLSGEYGAPGIDWHTCRGEDEEVVVSAPAALPSGLNGSGGDVEFLFPQPIPISATDLYLQVVFKGKLGEEEGAVVAETMDISEPTYAYNFVIWDQGMYWHYPSVDPGPYTFDQWCIQGYQSTLPCYDAMGTTYKYKFSADATPIPGYDPATSTYLQGTWYNLADEPPFTPVIRMKTPVGAFQRVAALMDVNPTNLALMVTELVDETHGNSLFQWATGTYSSAINQRDSSGNLTPAVTYTSGRGVYVPQAEAPRLQFRGTGLPAEPPNFTFIPSEVTF